MEPMKNGALLILSVVMVVFGALYVREHGKRRQSEATIAGLQQKADELEAQLTESGIKVVSLQKRLSNTRERVVAKAEEVTQLQQAITNRDAEAKTNHPMAQMFKGVGELGEFHLAFIWAEEVEVVYQFLERPDPAVTTSFVRAELPALETELSEAIARIQEGIFKPTPSEFICSGCPVLDVVCAGPRLRQHPETAIPAEIAVG